MQIRGLSLDQAPPLAIPLSFFGLAPCAVGGAAGVLLFYGAQSLVTPWSPVTLCLTHLGTLGLLTSVMFGALYQMTPVVAGSRIPGVRLAHAVHVGLALGVLFLCWGFARGSVAAIYVAAGLLAPAFLLFLIPVGVALARTATRDETVLGMTGAVTALFLAATLGLWMAHGFAGLHFPGPRPLWLRVHMTVALLGWVGGLITAISWQVLPMFYLARTVQLGTKRAIQALTGIGVVGPLGVLLSYSVEGAREDWRSAFLYAGLAALPAALGVWGIHPLVSLRSLAGRRRRRRDATLLFWYAGLSVAPGVALCAAAAVVWEDPRWELLLGWLAIWGWAGMIIHGMLSRIVPFLVWFHRFAPRVGSGPVPSMRALLPDRWVRQGFVAHSVSLGLGALAIVTRDDTSARLAGLALGVTATLLARSLLRVVRTQPAPLDSGEPAPG
ncbi:MAG: hypothetical protein ACE5IL_10435 [Myxococcota bacterium]